MIDPFDFDAENDPFELNAEMPVGILSPSSISTYMRCPEQFRREYVKKEKRAPGAWAISGTAFHHARHTILGGQRYGVEFDNALLREAYERAWAHAIEEVGETTWGSETPEVMHERGWAMTELYHNELGKEVIPIRMEYGAKGNVAGVPVPIYGRIDVETDEEIIDTKTGRQLFHKLRPEHYVQGILYCWLTKKPIRWHSVSEKPACATNENLTVAPTPKVLNAAERIARLAYRGIVCDLRELGPDEHWPGNGMASGSCNYCSFRKRCVFVPE